jgi:hypothetical protein
MGAPIMGTVNLQYVAAGGNTASAAPKDCPNTDMVTADIVTSIGAVATTSTTQDWSVYFDSLSLISN